MPQATATVAETAGETVLVDNAPEPAVSSTDAVAPAPAAVEKSPAAEAVPQTTADGTDEKFDPTQVPAWAQAGAAAQATTGNDAGSEQGSGLASAPTLERSSVPAAPTTAETAAETPSVPAAETVSAVPDVKRVILEHQAAVDELVAAMDEGGQPQDQEGTTDAANRDHPGGSVAQVRPELHGEEKSGSDDGFTAQVEPAQPGHQQSNTVRIVLDLEEQTTQWLRESARLIADTVSIASEPPSPRLLQAKELIRQTEVRCHTITVSVSLTL